MPWHSLRHTFGTVCAARGVPVPQIQRLMGHKDVTTTMRYISVSKADLEDAIDRAFGRKPRGRSEDVRGFVRNDAVSESSTVN
jgi:site-specific recombinase XerD